MNEMERMKKPVQGTFFPDFERNWRERKRRENAISQGEMELYSKNEKIKQPVIKGKKDEDVIKNKEEVTILWGGGYYPLPGHHRRDTDTAERVRVYFGSDFEWHVGEKGNERIVSEGYALELIESDEDRVNYNDIVEKIKKLKELKK